MKNTFLKSGVTLAAVIALSLPLVASAQMTQDVTVGQSSATAVTLPTAQVDASQHLLFRVMNPTGGPVNFTIPEIGINYPVPANSERTFFVDMSTVQTQQLAYSITDPNGAQLASGVITNPNYFAAESSVALNDIINYSTAYNAPIKPEPTYNTERPVSYQRSENVRGYW